MMPKRDSLSDRDKREALAAGGGNLHREDGMDELVRDDFYDEDGVFVPSRAWAEINRLREKHQRAHEVALDLHRRLAGPVDPLPPEGIDAHIEHRVSLTGGEDAPLGLFCDFCGEYLIEWGQ